MSRIFNQYGRNIQAMSVTGGRYPQASQESVIAEQAQYLPQIKQLEWQRENMLQQQAFTRRQDRLMRKQTRDEFRFGVAKTGVQAATHPLAEKPRAWATGKLGWQGRKAMQIGNAAEYGAEAGMRTDIGTSAGVGGKYAASTFRGVGIGTGASAFGTGMALENKFGMSNVQETVAGGMAGMSMAALTPLLGLGPVGWGGYALAGGLGMLGSKMDWMKKKGWFKFSF